MEGGMNAWEGYVASGPPEFGMAFFDEAADAGELIALAWLLEDGSWRFYAGVSSFVRDQEASRLFKTLSDAEVRHKESLVSLYRGYAGKDPLPEFRDILGEGDTRGDVMEGGMNVSEGLNWAKGRDMHSILELSMALETNSYDLYIKMERRFAEEKSRQVFESLISEERTHLKKLADLLEKNI
jgi:rubrerythrin